MLFLRNFERFYNLHAYRGRVGGNQLPPVNLLLPRMTGRNMRPHVIYFTNWPPLRLRWAHYFRMRDHGSSLFSAVKNLHFSLSLCLYLLPMCIQTCVSLIDFAFCRVRTRRLRRISPSPPSQLAFGLTSTCSAAEWPMLISLPSFRKHAAFFFFFFFFFGK